MTTETVPGAMAGLRVIDLTRVLGGPYCTQILADHGADVIKVEPPAGDEVRDWGPPFHEEDAAYFVGINRNKRSIGLDLASEGGRAVLLTSTAHTNSRGAPLPPRRKAAKSGMIVRMIASSGFLKSGSL